MYNHKRVDYEVELEACLDGLGAVWKNFVYHIPLQCHYLKIEYFHLKMVNILVAVLNFSMSWQKKKVLIKCDNAAVEDILMHGRTRDAFLAACTRNIWQEAALHDIQLMNPPTF